MRGLNNYLALLPTRARFCRVIGEDATISNVQEGPFREALELAFAKLNAIPGLIVKLRFEAASEAASNAGMPATQSSYCIS